MPVRSTSWIAIAAALALVGCSSGKEVPSNAAVPTTEPSALPAATPTPAATPMARAEKTDLLDFSYAYPAAVAATPAVAALLDKRADDAKAKALADAQQDKKAAGKSDFPFHAHEYHADWAVAGDTPRFLSLVGTVSDYTGGAHGMTVFDPLVWDRQASRSVEVADLFTTPAALDGALRDRFCDALDRERTRKRGEPVKRGDGMFSDCIDPIKEVIVPTASGKGAIDGLTVYVAPYDAGPYAEGDYQVSVPIDAAILSAVKAEFRPAFAVPR